MRLPYFLELLPPLYCSCTSYLARAKQNKPRPLIVPAPCACMIILVRVAQCSIVQSHTQHLNVQWNLRSQSTVQCSCNRSNCHDKVQISRLFGLKLLGAQCTYKHGSVVILIITAHVLFPPSNCTAC